MTLTGRASSVLARVLLPLGALAVGTSSLQGQSVLELLQSVQQGGGWVAIPIRSGVGEVRTVAIPNLGLSLVGCMRVWHGHSGRWHIEAQDLLGDGRLTADVGADEPVPFSYRPGGPSQLEARFRWSEPRDTTLVLWVGLSTGPTSRDTCAPVYGDAAGGGTGASARDGGSDVGYGTAGRQRVERVRNRRDAPDQWDLTSLEPLRITGAVHPLMARQRDLAAEAENLAATVL